MANEDLIKFVWKIKNFDMCPESQGQYLSSPEFSVGSYKLCLTVYPRGKTMDYTVAAYVKRLDDCGEDLHIQVKIFIETYNELICQFLPEECIKKNCEIGRSDLLKRIFFNRKRTMCFYKDYTLTIEGEIILRFPNGERVEVTKKRDDYQDMKNLSSDLEKILGSGRYSDTVIVVDEKEIPVHRAFIECRCQNLMSQLKARNEPNKYSLEGIAEPVLRKLLKYLYTGTIRVENMHEEMLVASTAYNIPHLRHSLNLPNVKTILATTEIVASRLSFDWVIQAFPKLGLNHELVYPTYLATENDWCEMKIILTVKEDCIQLNFRKMNSREVNFILCEISTDRSEEPIIKVDSSEISFIGNDWILPLSGNDRSNFMTKDTLQMYFDLSMTYNIQNSNRIDKIDINLRTENALCGEEITNFIPLQNNLRNLFNSGHLADFTVTPEAGVKCGAHSFILSGRSDSFAASIEQKCLESLTKNIDVCCDTETASVMLKYVYCGCIDNVMDFRKTVKLYKAAQQYNVTTLTAKCSSLIASFMGEENAEEITALAGTYSDDENLKKCVEDYFPVPIESKRRKRNQK